MKVTGIAIFCLGVAIGLFALFQMMTAVETTPYDGETGVADSTTSGTSTFPMAYAFIVTAAALVVGALLWAYGGKGTIETRNPAVRT